MRNRTALLPEQNVQKYFYLLQFNMFSRRIFQSQVKISFDIALLSTQITVFPNIKHLGILPVMLSSSWSIEYTIA
mgnify:FL=1